MDIDAILDYYDGQRDKKDQPVIVEMLKELQEANGYLTEELKERAAQTAGVSLSLINLLIKTYPSLKAAAYTHVITVCSGERCGKKCGGEIAALIRKELQVGRDGISKDGSCLVKTQNCLKQCRTSPNFMADGVLYSNVRPEQVKELLKKVRKG